MSAGQEAATALEDSGSFEAHALPDSSAGAREQAKKRPSMLQRVLSAVVVPLRGGTMSSGDGTEGSSGAAECQRRTASVMSELTIAPGTASLAQLSSERGLSWSSMAKLHACLLDHWSLRSSRETPML